MKNLRYVAILLVAPVLASVGCHGGLDENAELSMTGQPVTTPMTCSESLITFADASSSSAKCAGPWKYYVPSITGCMSLEPSIDCSGSQYPTGKSCNHAHATGAITRTVTVAPIKVPFRRCGLNAEFCDPGIKCCWVDYYNDYEAACTSKAYGALSDFPNTNLDLRSPITVTINQADGPDCTYTLQNAPLSWHNAVDDVRCASSTVSAPDHEHPILATCRGSTRTTCVPTIADANITTCTTGPNAPDPTPQNCGVAQKISPPGLSLDELAAKDPLLVRGDSRYPAHCTTGEQLPTQTGAQVRAKMAFYQAQLRDNTGIIGADSRYFSRLASNAKLLFELHGNALTEPDIGSTSLRDFAIDLYGTSPGDAYPCLDHSAPRPEVPRATIERFEGYSPASWSGWSYRGEVTAVGDGFSSDSTYAARVGTNGWLVRALGSRYEGLVSLRYRIYCSQPSDTPSAMVLGQYHEWDPSAYDGEGGYVLQQIGFPLVKQCTTDSQWQFATIDLARFRGLAPFEAFYIDIQSRGRSSIIVDDITYPDWSRPHEIDGQLRACERVSLSQAGDSHVPLKVAESLAPYCIERAVAVKSVAQGVAGAAARTSYIDAYISMTNSLLKALLGYVPPAGTGFETPEQRRPVLQNHLALIGKWFASVRTGIFVSDATGTADEKLWKATSDIVGYAWQGLYQPAYDQFKANNNLGDYRTAGLASDREMLDALFPDPAWPAPTGTPPLTTAPALLFVADAVKPTLDRTDRLTPYHDLGCRFLDCTRPAKVTELSSMYRITANLPSASGLSAELTAADNAKSASSSSAFFSKNWAAWRGTMGRVQARHADVLQAAVKDALNTTAGYEPAMLADAPASGAPAVVALAGLVQRTAKSADNYSKGGLFNKESARSLPVGLLTSSIRAIDSNVAGSLAALDEAIRSFNDEMRNYVGALTAEIDDTTRTNDLEARKQALLDRAAELSKDQSGLAISETVDESRFADQNARLEAVMRSAGSKLLSANDIGTWSLEGGDGRFVNGQSYETIQQLAVERCGEGGSGGRVASGQPGEVLNFSVSGTYQPSCALQALSGSFYGAAVNPITSEGSKLQDAEAGSSGYEFQSSTSGLQSHAITNTTSETWHANADLCASSPNWFVSIKACFGYQWSKSWSDSSTRGNEARNSASFALGLRLPGTPFPSYPAGALLAVLMKPGSVSPSDILDVQVVQQPQGTITFGRAADVYLVVNDADCRTMGTSKRLTVTATKLVPAAESAKQIAAAMQSIEKYLREPDPVSGLPSVADSRIAQGRLMPSDLADLKTEAFQRLRTSCNSCDVATSFDGVLRGFFETWLDWQLSHISREIGRISILREMNHIQTEAAALDRDLGLAGQRGRLARLLPMWALRNLDYANDKLNLSTRSLVNMVSEALQPMVYLRYPELLGGLTTPQKLLGLDWVDEPLGKSSDEGTSLASKVALAIREITQKLDSAIALSTDPTSGDVTEAYALLRFPNPYDPISADSGGLPLAGREADVARAQRVWDAIRDHFQRDIETPIRFEVRPDDLYQAGTVNALLGCNLVSPVIKSMAIYLVTGLSKSTTADSLNSQSFLSPTKAQRVMWFPTTFGIDQFSFDNDDYVSASSSKLYYGAEEEWQARFEGKNGFSPLSPIDLSQSIKGISPFTSFSLAALGALGDPWWGTTDEARDLVVVFRLEARRKGAAGGSAVSGISTCPATAH